MRFVKLIVCVALLVGVQTSYHAEGVYFGFGVGGGDLEIGTEFIPDLAPSMSDNDGALVIDFLAGYEFSNGLFVDLGVENYSNLNFLNLFDVVSASSSRIAVGYFIPSESRFRFYGKTGINFWELDLKEGSISNPGPEEAIQGSDGQDPFFEIGVNYHLNPKYRFGLNYSYSDTEFGEMSGVKITTRWSPWGR